MKKQINNQIEMRVTLHAIELEGNTYPYRQALKELGFVWDPTFRCWKLRFPFKPSQASLDIERDDPELDKFLEEFPLFLILFSSLFQLGWVFFLLSDTELHILQQSDYRHYTLKEPPYIPSYILLLPKGLSLRRPCLKDTHPNYLSS